jgi:hypothetical protein
MTSTARRNVRPGILLFLIAGAQLMVVLDATISYLFASEFEEPR